MSGKTLHLPHRNIRPSLVSGNVRKQKYRIPERQATLVHTSFNNSLHTVWYRFTSLILPEQSKEIQAEMLAGRRLDVKSARCPFWRWRTGKRLCNSHIYIYIWELHNRLPVRHLQKGHRALLTSSRLPASISACISFDCSGNIKEVNLYQTVCRLLLNDVWTSVACLSGILYFCFLTFPLTSEGRMLRCGRCNVLPDTVRPSSTEKFEVRSRHPVFHWHSGS